MFGSRLRLAQFLEHPRVGLMRAQGCVSITVYFALAFSMGRQGEGLVFAASLGSEEYR